MEEDTNTPENPTGPPTDITQIDPLVEQKIDELFEMNQNIILASRKAAREALILRDAFLIQADRCNEIAELNALGAAMVSNLTADVISMEWGLGLKDIDDDSDSEDFDEEDEETGEEDE